MICVIWKKFLIALGIFYHNLDSAGSIYVDLNVSCDMDHIFFLEASSAQQWNVFKTSPRHILISVFWL